MSSGARTRATAARVVASVTAHGRSLSEALPPALGTLPDARERSLVQAMVYGTIRFQPRLQLLLDELLDRPLKKREAELNGLLLLGLHQISGMGIPDHAAVAATVDAAKLIGRPRARGLVNAVLRRYLREQAALDAEVDAHPEGRYGHRDWMIQAIRQDWPGAWEKILDENNLHPPMWLRVNAARESRESWMAMAGAPASEPSPWAPEALRLEQPVDVDQLPGFTQGLVSVQDAAAQLAAHLVAPAPGQRCLDACAAPGGKTGHLLELCPGLDLTAVDSDPERLRRVEENLSRLGFPATLVCADAADTGQWWDGQPFDSILLDAPCTASGVIRRHPDIKLLRRPADISRLSTLQARLLDQLWPLLAAGGRLVYCTCSVFRAEGPRQIEDFLGRTPDARLDPARTGDGWGVDAKPGRQVLPGETGMDGFYYACLEKSG
jgi:16S rRNA (cytosine967-C5)-methyltransferase